ncbi:hypothetical protein [Psychromonas hadalis]|uniref:hypothetical protein n=1 Tax=Psychromonas hadalis TaxID=211669 RepID=UPI0003B649F0|nr:hypothetical protein [Psychromonas hadalis]
MKKNSQDAHIQVQEIANNAGDVNLRVKLRVNCVDETLDEVKSMANESHSVVELSQKSLLGIETVNVSFSTLDEQQARFMNEFREAGRWAQEL